VAEKKIAEELCDTLWPPLSLCDTVWSPLSSILIEEAEFRGRTRGAGVCKYITHVYVQKHMEIHIHIHIHVCVFVCVCVCVFLCVCVERERERVPS
jgi:hypothetical protein